MRALGRSAPRLIGSALVILLTASSADAFAGKAGLQVTWKQGRVESARAERGPWRVLELGASVAVGTLIRTGAESRVELEAPDGSVIRLGAKGRLEVEAALAAKEHRQVGLRLWVGRVWAQVTKAMTGDTSRFEVRTGNAVAGVRGTSFTVLADQDLSSLVRVYAGTVGVRGAKGKRGSRRQIAGPKRVSLAEWREVIATAMTEVRVSALGEIRPAETFEDEGESLEWAQWNQARDADRR